MQFDSKEEARNVLADILGFTRHERLDVKKPGPLAGPPPSNQVPIEHESKQTPPKNNTKNKVEIKNEDVGPKTKKIPSNDHSGNDDHAPHVVDTAYAHVRLKNA